MKPVALITGAAGLIGGYLARSAPRWVPGWEVRGVTRAEVDSPIGRRSNASGIITGQILFSTARR